MRRIAVVFGGLGLAGCVAALPTRTEGALDELSERCLSSMLDQGCGVVSAGLLNDAPSGGRLFWQVQDGASAADGVGGGVVVFAHDNGRLTPVIRDFDAWRYEPPQFVEMEDGSRLLVIHGVSRGTAASPVNRAWRWEDGRWRSIDTDGWLRQAEAIPGAVSIQSVPRIDFNGPRAVSPLWRPSDGRCCPTGGWAHLDFELRDGALRLVKARRAAD